MLWTCLWLAGFFGATFGSIDVGMGGDRRRDALFKDLKRHQARKKHFALFPSVFNSGISSQDAFVRLQRKINATIQLSETVSAQYAKILEHFWSTVCFPSKEKNKNRLSSKTFVCFVHIGLKLCTGSFLTRIYSFVFIKIFVGGRLNSDTKFLKNITTRRRRRVVDLLGYAAGKNSCIRIQT